jgi:hypothetical protein
MQSSLKVTSHVGRDLLAAAASFKKEDSVVWEYVVNSLQYVDPGIIPNVQVNISPKKGRIEILDNGRGMTTEDLKRFFTMHGENIDRSQGRPGRGKFGTGKSAAFGIANQLTIQTTRNGLRNRVELTRGMIDLSSGKDIPLNWLEKEEQTDEPNGTVIEIDGVYLKKISIQPVCDYIERHLSAFRNTEAKVAVNSHICEYREPEYSDVKVFRPNDKQVEDIGDVELTIKVSKVPLEKSAQGIAISSGVGNLVAIEDGGISGKEFGNFLFGEVDVPALELSDSKIEPYDTSRSLQLNPSHPVASVLLGFIGSKLDEVRRELAKEAREARKTEEARRLAQEADKIAELINEDYRQYRDRLSQIRSATSKRGHTPTTEGGDGAGDETQEGWVEGLTQRGDISPTYPRGPSERQSTGEGRSRAKKIEPNEDGKNIVDPAEKKSKGPSRSVGGFGVEYAHLGTEEHRSRYDPTRLTILINLDHPVVDTSLQRNGPEDISFRRLAYEIAFTEYSMAVGYEFIQQDPDMPADELLYEVRSTLNRVTRRASMLYR